MDKNHEEVYQRLLKKASHSWAVSLLLSPLALLSGLFFVGVVVRRFFLTAQAKRRKTSTPIVSIGNVTVGGSGKTPFLSLLLSLIPGKIALVTRGYRRSEQGLYITSGACCTPHQGGDEACLIGRRFPSVTIAVSEDKWEAVKMVDGRCDLIFIDDGGQRYDIPQQVKIATVDCSCPDGYGWLLPRGLLREPFSWLRHADYIVITNPTAALPSVRRSLEALSRPIIVTAPVLTHFFTSDQKRCDLQKGQKVALFSGIAMPERFCMSMKALGYEVVDHLVLQDHGDISDEVLKRFIARVRSLSPDVVIVGTEKDWARRLSWPECDILFSHMECTVIDGHEAFTSLLRRLQKK